MIADTPGLQASGLRLGAAGQRLIDIPELHLSPSGLSVIMGPNGAGKSLLLRLLHGLIAPDGGQIHWDGAALNNDLRKRQAMVFQRPVLLRRSVAANVDFALRARGRADPQRRADLLAHVGLTGRETTPARKLSGGEAQRLALARALATGPDMLFLDEPTASLDPASTQRIEEIVRDIARRGVKVIFVTHDIAQARRLADEVVFIAQGRVTDQGGPHLFTTPQSAAMHAYLDGRLTP